MTIDEAARGDAEVNLIEGRRIGRAGNENGERYTLEVDVFPIQRTQ